MNEHEDSQAPRISRIPAKSRIRLLALLIFSAMVGMAAILPHPINSQPGQATTLQKLASDSESLEGQTVTVHAPVLSVVTDTVFTVKAPDSDGDILVVFDTENGMMDGFSEVDNYGFFLASGDAVRISGTVLRYNADSIPDHISLGTKLYLEQYAGSDVIYAIRVNPVTTGKDIII